LGKKNPYISLAAFDTTDRKTVLAYVAMLPYARFKTPRGSIFIKKFQECLRAKEKQLQGRRETATS